MESISSLTAPLMKGLRSIEGECETHGAQVVQVPEFLSDYPWFCPECSALKAKQKAEQDWLRDRSDTLHRIACIPPKYRGARFEAKTPEQKYVRSTVQAFRKAITAEKRWTVLVLFGGLGTGKTLLASELGEFLINNLSMSVRYCTAKQMIAEVQASYSSDSKSEEGEVLRFVQYDLLIIDEIDIKPDRENGNLLLTEIINRRYNEEKPVVIVTNQPFDSLAKFVGDRVADRLHENAYVCSLNGKSYRSSI